MINSAMKGRFDAEYLCSLVGRKEEGAEQKIVEESAVQGKQCTGNYCHG
jgi:hypothetical protein